MAGVFLCYGAGLKKSGNTGEPVDNGSSEDSCIRGKFYDLLNNTDGEDFLAYYGERKLIPRVAFERYLRNHPELRRRV